jgi:RNA polymerase sigma-70 factor, ECF subfamily
VDELTMLAKGAVDGDDVALAELVRRTQHAVEGLCRVLADLDEVEDVVQEVYLRFVAALPGFRFDSPVLPWLLSIARRTCTDVVRRRSRRRRLLDRYSALPPPAFVEPASAGELVGVFDLLSGLDPDRRIAFVLTQLIGLSYEEAAEVCEFRLGPSAHGSRGRGPSWHPWWTKRNRPDGGNRRDASGDPVRRWQFPVTSTGKGSS